MPLANEFQQVALLGVVTGSDEKLHPTPIRWKRLVSLWGTARLVSAQVSPTIEGEGDDIGLVVDKRQVQQLAEQPVLRRAGLGSLHQRLDQARLAPAGQQPQLLD